jgi:DNA-binding NtrC family response regulator/tetratricopeptide (TPR) repeat protein
MSELLADRFLPWGTTWIDLASGAAVRLRRAEAGSEIDRLVWSDWCATLARMRHPLLNQLVDYGFADAGRTFEAYCVAPPVPARGAGILRHLVRFLEANALHLSRDVAALALRQICAARGAPRRRPLGIMLQPRRAIETLDEVLADVAPGGVVALTVLGQHGSGLRTLRAHVARSARLQGYIPVAASLIASAPRIVRRLGERHVCVLLDPDTPRDVEQTAAALAATLGLQSARRHVLVRFSRAPAAAAETLRLEPMGVTAMISMVYLDPDCGPDRSSVVAAARSAEGNPGQFLLQLGASPFPEHQPASVVVHESATAYVTRSRSVPNRPGAPDTTSIDDADSPLHGSRPPSRSILSAGHRAARLAARGRHASAIRLLTRATRVLERRGERLVASQCAEQLGWILRDRGRTDDALEHFARCRTLAGDKIQEIRGSIATGVAWTDQCRFAEAEAALRGALTAADLLRDIGLEHRARLALGRCLYWSLRADEAAIVLEPVLDRESPCRAEGLALSTRISVAQGDLRAAVRCAGEALAEVDDREPRLVAAAARAMAFAQAALGDDRHARASIRQGLAAASAAHTPLQALRLRTILAWLGDRHSSTPGASAQLCGNLARRSLPPLLLRQLEDDPRRQLQSPRVHGGELPSSAIEQLQELLELAYSAPNDGAGVAAVAKTLCERLRAAAVLVVAAGPDRRLLGRAGRPWAGDLRLVERALANAGSDAVFSSEAPLEAAQHVGCGGQTIAVLACRWTPTAAVDRASASALLRTGALAMAPAVRAMLERPAALDTEPAWRELIGASPQTLSLREAITRAARAPFPVLIEGESGSGKELVARAVHRLSPRRDRRLCAVNCAALSEDLLEAELFGHARGAFTGAVGERAGLFEEADGGTLFLDEVGELSPRAQAKLLRVLQDGEVRRVGENFARRVDARVIAATNRCLEDDVGVGRFRADLRFRLDVVRIAVPPLRERAVDIPLLVAHFWEEAARRVDSRAWLTPETVQALARYDWPGNVRQLQNVIASLAVHAPRRGRVPVSLLPAHVARTAASAATTFGAAREEFERRFIVAELARAAGQRAKAARALGVTRQGLAKMMKRLGMEEERLKAEG